MTRTTRSQIESISSTTRDVVTDGADAAVTTVLTTEELTIVPTKILATTSSYPRAMVTTGWDEMDENDQEFLEQIADVLDRPRTRSTSAFVKSMASGKGTPSGTSELLYELIGLS